MHNSYPGGPKFIVYQPVIELLNDGFYIQLKYFGNLFFLQQQVVFMFRVGKVIVEWKALGAIKPEAIPAITDLVQSVRKFNI